MVSLIEGIILVGVSVLLFKKHPLSAWWKALWAAQTAFKKELHENTYREVEEYKTTRYLGQTPQE